MKLIKIHTYDGIDSNACLRIHVIVNEIKKTILNVMPALEGLYSAMEGADLYRDDDLIYRVGRDGSLPAPKPSEVEI